MQSKTNVCGEKKKKKEKEKEKKEMSATYV